MKLHAFFLVLMLLGGCSSIPVKDASQPALIHENQWRHLKASLQGNNKELIQALSETAESRLKKSSGNESSQDAGLADPREMLVNLLLTSGNRLLLPDDEFVRIHDVVAGENQHTGKDYVNALADFMTRHDFACSQPAYASYFQRKYSTKADFSQCAPIVPFAMLTRFEGVKITWLDIRRIRSIHVLYAGKGQNIASAFGHVALRLVVCPDENSTDDECDANLFDHIVLGFRAKIDDFSLDMLKALNGDYNAYLLANRFMDVYEEYAIGEFREIYSLPLLMKTEQREAMIRTLSEIHWRYSGAYSFFSRNCASLLQNAIRISWPEFSRYDLSNSNFIRPDSLFQAIKNSSAVNHSVFSDLDVAEQRGWYFSSTRQFYDKALEEVHGEMKKPDFSSLESYLKINPVVRRQSRAEDIKFSKRLASDTHLRGAQILLEEYAVLNSEKLLFLEIAKYLEQIRYLDNDVAVRSKLDAEHLKFFEDCMVYPFKFSNRYTHKFNGIPDQYEIGRNPEPSSNCQSSQSRSLLLETLSGIGESSSGQWRSLTEAAYFWMENVANVNLLKY